MTLQIQLKRSSALNSAPTPGQLKDGELGLNYNADSMALYAKDSAGNIRQIAGTGAESGFWERTGDTIRPIEDGLSVKIGDDKIQLLESGSGSFTGKVTSAETVDGDSNTTLVTKGYVDTSVGSQTLQSVTDEGNTTTNDVVIGGTAQSPQILLNNDGSADFQGKLTSEETVAGDADETLVTKGYVDSAIPTDFGVTKLTAGSNITLDPTDGLGEVEITADFTAPVTSVNGETGDVVLDAADIGALAPGDNVSELTNDAGYITDAGVTQLTAGAGISLDPVDGLGSVQITATGGGGGIPEAPNDGRQYGRQSESWTEITGGSGGVTSIIAGAGISVDPAGGTGDVTITNTGGGGGGVTSHDLYGTAKVQVSVNANGSYSGAVGVADVQKLGGNGNYRIVFQTPFASTDYQVVFGQTSITISWSNKTVNSVDVRTRSQSPPVESDQAFDISIFDNQPEVITSGTGTVTSTNIFGIAHAWGEVAANGNLMAGRNVQTSYVSDNYYAVAIDPPMASDDYAVVFGALTGASAYVSSKESGSFGVILRATESGSPIQGEFSFACYDERPAEVALTTSGDVINIDYSGAAAWCEVATDNSLLAGMNIAEFSRTGQGRYTVLFATPMPSSTYSVVGSSENRVIGFDTLTPTGFNVTSRDGGSGFFDLAENLFIQVAATNALPPMGQGTGADAWAEVDDAGNLLASYNIDGCTYSAPGTYDYVFVSPMPSDNYAVVVTGSRLNAPSELRAYYKTRNGFQVYSNDSTGSSPVAVGHSVVVHATNATLPFSFTSEQIEAAINNPGFSAWGTMNSGVLVNGLNCTTSRIDKGKYQINFITPMPNNRYSITTTNNSQFAMSYINKTAEGVEIRTTTNNGTQLADCALDFQVAATNALPPRGQAGVDAWASVSSSGQINSSFNISNVTSQSPGNYLVQFTVPMPDAKYAVNATGNGSSYYDCFVYNRTAAGFMLGTRDASGNAGPSAFSCVINATNATLPSTFTESQIQSVIDLATGGGIDSYLLPLKSVIESLESRIAAIEGEMTGD